LHTTSERRALVERILCSDLLTKSARLRDLLQYLTGRVFEDASAEIHEQEVGRQVFGRPADYDTATDNIVRVHASTLRKRLERYFSEEGAAEPLILEIPKGNYAPVFRERALVLEPVPLEPTAPVRTDWRIWVLAAVALLFASLTAILWTRKPQSAKPAMTPAVRAFWSKVFRPGQATDLVLDDAAVGLYQELEGRNLSLSGYFDRSYLRNVPDSSASLVLRRQSNYSSAALLWKLFEMDRTIGGNSKPVFARDFSFRALKADNAVLLGNSRSNPWIEPFEARTGIRWLFDKDAGVYDPVDTWSGNLNFRAASTTEPRESYFSISLQPNLGGNGNVLIISGTGGSAINMAAEFLTSEAALQNLSSRLGNGNFPPFEALVRLQSRHASAQDAAIVICRAPR
jgi:hypothetical protein